MKPDFDAGNTIKHTFRQCVNRHFKMPENSIESLYHKIKLVELSPQKVLWSAGEQLQKIFFLNEGLLYAYFETSEGKSFCKEMYWGNDLIFGFRSLLSKTPLPFYVKAIERSQLFALDVKDYWSAIRQDKHWKAFHQAGIQEYYLYKETKEEFLLLHNPQQRVVYFYEHYPELVERVPQHIVASYLGITPISLSRIKQRLKK